MLYAFVRKIITFDENLKKPTSMAMSPSDYHFNSEVIITKVSYRC